MTCAALKMCPLRSEHCDRPDGLCVMLLDRLAVFAKDNGWASTRQTEIRNTAEFLHSYLITLLAEKSVTPQHELIVRMLEETGHNGTGDMTTHEVYVWMEKEKLV